MRKLVHGTTEYAKVKQEILTTYGVMASHLFDASRNIRQRIDYLKNFLRNNGLSGYVLGISGGVDSTAAGRLAQLACEELRKEGIKATFVAMRLPSGVQHDENDAQEALKFINPDVVLTVNIGQAADMLNIQNLLAIESVSIQLTPHQADFNKGNIKARLRMTAQYHTAAVYNAAVIGTDHNSECVTGFFTKFGDGACDLTVLNNMNKTQVRMLAKELGAPDVLWQKYPTADLEELNPGKHDQDGFGFPYEALDDFLEGKNVPPELEEKIIHQYLITNHKRKPINTYI